MGHDEATLLQQLRQAFTAGQENQLIGRQAHPSLAFQHAVIDLAFEHMRFDGIAYLRERDEEVDLACVMRSPLAIAHLPDTSEAVQMMAMMYEADNTAVFWNIRKPTHETLLLATENPAIDFREIQEQHGRFFFDGAPESLLLEAAVKSPYAAAAVSNPSREMLIVTIKNFPWIFSWMQRDDPELERLALTYRQPPGMVNLDVLVDEKYLQRCNHEVLDSVRPGLSALAMIAEGGTAEERWSLFRQFLHGTKREEAFSL